MEGAVLSSDVVHNLIHSPRALSLSFFDPGLWLHFRHLSSKVTVLFEPCLFQMTPASAVAGIITR